LFSSLCVQERAIIRGQYDESSNVITKRIKDLDKLKLDLAMIDELDKLSLMPQNLMLASIMVESKFLKITLLC